VLETVEPVDRLDDDALDSQVVAPHLLDELGVVSALDEDATRASDARSPSRHGAGSRGGDERTACCRRGRHELDGLALEQESDAEREHASRAEAVLERHEGALARDDRTGEA